MANRTRGRDFERRVRRISTAAQGAENARSAAARLSRERASSPTSVVNSPDGAA
jgi:hypothetical protein